MNAREIVDLLLEADQPSASERTGVYIFGPRLPEKGYNALDLNQALSDFERVKIIPQGSAQKRNDLLDQLTKMGYTFFIKHDPGSIEVIGKVPAHTTPEGQKRAMQFLGLERGNTVAHRSGPTGSPEKLNVDYALFGSKDLEREQKEKEATAKAQEATTAAQAAAAAKEQEAAAKEKRSVPTQAFGKVDPKEAKFPNPPTGVGYRGDVEPMPLNAPVNVGFQYDMNSDQGIQVMEVIPGGPAAQAGLQAGDIIIQTGKFAPVDGGEAMGPFYVYNTKHLSYVLRKADPQYPISFRVHRGDKDMWIPIKPEPKPKQPQGPEMHIPAAEVQAAAGQPAQPGQRPKLNLQGRLAKLMGQQPNKPFPGIPPNVKTPARETGNPPANVSSLT